MAKIKVFQGLVTGHPAAIEATALYLVGEQPRNVHALHRVQLPNYTTVWAAVIPSDPSLGATGTTFDIICEDGSEWLEAVHAEAAEDVARLRHEKDAKAHWSAAAIAAWTPPTRTRGTALSRARNQDRDAE